MSFGGGYGRKRNCKCPGDPEDTNIARGRKGIVLAAVVPAYWNFNVEIERISKKKGHRYRVGKDALLRCR